MKKALPLFLIAATALALFAFTGCNHVRIAAQPPGGGEIKVYQGAWKSAVGKDNAVEATTDAAAQASLK